MGTPIHTGDKYDQLEHWLEALTVLGVDVDEQMPRTLEAIAKVETYELAARTFRKATTSEGEAIQRVAQLTGAQIAPATIIEQANLAAFASQPEHAERVEHIIERAVVHIQGQAVARFRKEGVLNALRPEFERRAELLAEQVNAIAFGVNTAEHAARYGYAAEFAELDENVRWFDGLSSTLGSLMKEKALRAPDARTGAIDYLVQDPAIYRAENPGGDRGVRYARALVTAGLHLHEPDKGTAPLNAVPLHDVQNAAHVHSLAEEKAREELERSRRKHPAISRRGRVQSV